MAPYSWQTSARRWIGPATEPWVQPLSGLESRTGENGRFLIFEDQTPALDKLNCHYSILPGGTSPHPPHTHIDEEIIVPLEGEVEIVRGESADAPGTRIERTGPGGLVFHASNQPHTIRAVGPGPARYVVARWIGRGAGGAGGLAAGTIDLQPHWEALAQNAADSGREVVVEQPTALLHKLQVHVSRMAPGGGSPEHVDAHDVLVLVLEGALETGGERAEAPSLIFNPAFAPHFMKNAGDSDARYLVIELHSSDDR